MVIKKFSFVLVVAIALAGLIALPISAAVKSMSLAEKVEIHTSCVYGQIIEKSTIRIDWADMQDVVFTRLVIQGEDWSDGQPVTRTLYYMGGPDYYVSTSPKESQTRVGAWVVAFHWFDASLTADGAQKIFSFADIYQVQQGAGEPTVIGRGEGSGVPYHVKLSVLKDRIMDLFAAKQAKEAEEAQVSPKEK